MYCYKYNSELCTGCAMNVMGFECSQLHYLCIKSPYILQRYFPWRIETMANKSLGNLAFAKVTQWGGHWRFFFLCSSFISSYRLCGPLSPHRLAQLYPSCLLSGVIFGFKRVRPGLEKGDCNCGTKRWCANTN